MTKMTKMIELVTAGGEPLTQSLPLATDDGTLLSVATLRAAAAALLAGDGRAFSLRYMDSDGDEVTVARDEDVKELADYMADEQLERLTVLVVVHGPPAGAMQKQLRGLVTAMTKLTTDKPKQPTPANAVNLLVASLQTMDVADESKELAAVKRELLSVLQAEEFRQVVEELSASEEFKELADAMVTAIYQEDAQAIEETATARFDELLTFFQRVVARCPTLKPVLVNVAKKCMTGLVRYNDEELAQDGSNSSSSSSSSSSSTSSSVEILDTAVEEVPVHLNVICDGCEKTPLVDVRYKSLQVPDFDVCEECEASGKWVSHEPFIKITDPSRAPRIKQMTELVHSFVACDGCEMSPIVGIRFKSKTEEDFDLCAACEASGKWNESHGPFTKIQEPGMMRGLKFTCRRGQFEHHGKFGHHHGKFGRHGRHGEFGHHGHHERFGRHDQHGPPGFPFHGSPPHPHGPPEFFGRPPHHEGPPGFPGRGPPAHHEGPPGFPGHGPPPRREGFPPPPHVDGRPDFSPPPHHEGLPDFGGRGRPDFPEFFDRRGRHHHGPPPFGPPGRFRSFGPPPFGFPHPHGPPPCPPDLPPEFDRRDCGFRDHHGRHGRHMRFPDDDEEQEEGRSRHGFRGRGRWARNVSGLEARFLEDVTIEDGTVVEAGKPLRKMWKLGNDGERSWPDGCYMITQPGNPMFPEDWKSSRIDLPALAPGEEFIAGVDLVAPNEPGRYSSFWRVCDPADVSFGHRFWIDIVVAGDTTPASTPSEAPTADSTEDVEIKDSSEVATDALSDDDIEIIDSAEAQGAEGVAEEVESSEKKDKADKAEFEEALELLASMGFVDKEKNLRALELADGNVGGAVNALLSE